MNRARPNLLFLIYILLALLAASIASPLPYPVVALALLLLMLLAIFRPQRPRFNIVVAMVTAALLPLVLEPVLKLYLADTLSFSPMRLPIITAELTPVQLAAVFTALPVLYFLSYSLKQNALNTTPVDDTGGRRFTPVPLVLFISVLALLLVSLAVANPMLFSVGILLLLHLLFIMRRLLRAVPSGQPLGIASTTKRLIAGSTAGIRLDVQSRASLELHCLIKAADSWVKISPQRFTLEVAEKRELKATVTPPLSGPSCPRFQVSAGDPWGFSWLNQVVEPLKLEVIPRARYAHWLAMKYLERAGAGAAADTSLPPEITIRPRRGTEYVDSRDYQPGDRLHDIDWKHTLKLNQLTVKEFMEGGGQTAIIVANLSVADAEEADKLAFKLITTALTLAGNMIPAALAVFGREKVILATAAESPDRILKQTLKLVGEISPQGFPERFLQLPDITRLRRGIARLKQSSSSPARRLLGVLEFEFRAIRAAAKNHPATVALRQVTHRVSPPGTIVLVSQPNHDAEALLVTLEKLTRGGYNILRL